MINILLQDFSKSNEKISRRTCVQTVLHSYAEFNRNKNVNAILSNARVYYYLKNFRYTSRVSEYRAFSIFTEQANT